ncbi:membrane protein [Corynebacterium atypicum]|uniref:TVP38/TMEM64 family membrane protein n=1 Tax=Corynebacterium atypicum TaxID=191610 RepID=A0ABN4DFJ6_9CORY|nr:TVP38/TMEM64 family protein [Corynebacterium atypicum]AIG64117.1 membrane protein [Corynebacterium atypicum]
MLSHLWWWLRSFADFFLGLLGDAYRSVKAWPAWRKVLVAVAVAAAAAALIFFDVPTLAQLRRWSDQAGDGFVVLFWLLYIGITQFPVPRTFLTLASGILFGPLVGAVLAISATTVSAMVSLCIIRGLLGDWMRPRLKHPAVAGINARLVERGWLAVGSLRLIAGIPFFVLNCAAALSPVKVLPFTIATLVGSAPNTIALVFFGDTLTGHADPVIVVVAVAFGLIGVAGLIADGKMPVHSRP